MSKATPKPIGDAKRFAVIEDGSIVYECDSALEGMAFIQGRRGGVLYGVLYRPSHFEDSQSDKVERQRARPARKAKRKVAKAG